jgi:hypothetical protein
VASKAIAPPKVTGLLNIVRVIAGLRYLGVNLPLTSFCLTEGRPVAVTRRPFEFLRRSFTVGTSSSSSVSSEWSAIVFGLILWVILEAEDWALLCDLFLLMCE